MMEDLLKLCSSGWTFMMERHRQSLVSSCDLIQKCLCSFVFVFDRSVRTTKEENGAGSRTGTNIFFVVYFCTLIQ